MRNLFDGLVALGCIMYLCYEGPHEGCEGHGQQMGYRSLEWNWPKEAMNKPIWVGIVDGAKLF